MGSLGVILKEEPEGHCITVTTDDETYRIIGFSVSRSLKEERYFNIYIMVHLHFLCREGGPLVFNPDKVLEELRSINETFSTEFKNKLKEGLNEEWKKTDRGYRITGEKFEIFYDPVIHSIYISGRKESLQEIFANVYKAIVTSYVLTFNKFKKDPEKGTNLEKQLSGLSKRLSSILGSKTEK